jgi:putative membrane protein
VLNLARGFLMGTADAVPGVSGGTIALLVGIYERLVHAVSTAAGALGLALRGRPGEGLRRFAGIDWLLIGPLVVGILAAIVLLARLIEHMLEEWPIEMAAVFLGLVAASAYVAWGMIRRPAGVHLPIALVAAAVAFALLGIKGGELTDPSLTVVFGAGAVAICAMILPGVSGSFLLLMLGMYDYVIGAVNDRDLLVLVVFAAGCITGLALFSSLLDWSLRHHHDVIVAALVGLMVGSLRVLWPWPDGVESSALHAPPADGWVVPLVLAVLAAAIVVGLATAARRRAPASREPESASSA